MQPFRSPATMASAGPRRAHRRDHRLAIMMIIWLSIEAAARAQPAPPPGRPRTPPASNLPGPALAEERPAPSAAPPGADRPMITVIGRVVDVRGRPVARAHVAVEASPGEAISDDTGRFQIAAPLGSSLAIERDGYDPALASVSDASLDDIVLLVAGSNAETIEIRGEAPAASPGAAKLERRELSRIPGTGGDFVRTLTAMPGVVNLQLPLGYGGVVIRGASPQDSKVLVDGFEVPLLFHNIGFRAVLPAESIESLDYIPGGFDVSSGRSSSGIIKLSTRPGSAARSEQAEISLLDGGLLAQGSIGARTRYMIGLRRSTIDLVLPSLIPDTADLSLTTVPRYYDGQLRIDHELSARWHLMLSSIGADDVLDIVASKDADATSKRLHTHTAYLRTTAAASFHDGPWSASFALSGLLPQYDATNGQYQFIHWTFPTATPRVEVARTGGTVAGLQNVVWLAGAEAQISHVDLDLAVPLEQREGEPNPAQDPKDMTTRFTGGFWVPDTAAWTSLAADLHPRIRLTAGVRGDRYGRTDELVIEPRAELQIKLPYTLIARLSAGMYSRPPEYQSELLTRTLRSERSAQTIAGLSYEPTPGTRVQASAYYTDRSALITHKADGALGNEGTGTTAGAEVLATYRGGPWFTWLSYSYSHSTRVDHPGMARRLFDFDQPHSLNAAASWQRGHWQLGGRFQVYSGLPYTPAVGAVLDSDHNVYVPEYGPVNSERAPIHHQLDLRVDYAWRWGAAAMTAFLDIQNIYMNESVVTYFYNYDYSQRTGFKSLPLLPSLGLRGVL
jgi:hypothetical protein